MHPPSTSGAIFCRAVLTCLLNPKAYAFMLAVFPAFMLSATSADAATTALSTRALQLGSIIAATQVAVYGAVAVSAASARRWAGASPQAQRWTACTVGATLIVGALLTLALAWHNGLPTQTPSV